MSVISIGIQTIMPKTGTSQKPAPPQQPSKQAADDAAGAVRQAPPPAGMGKFVDKTV